MKSFFIVFWVGEVAITLRKRFLDGFLQLNSTLCSFEIVVFDFLKIKIVDQESCGNDVILIDVLDKWFDSSFLDEFFLVEGAFDLSEVVGNSSD